MLSDPELAVLDRSTRVPGIRQLDQENQRLPAWEVERVLRAVAAEDLASGRHYLHACADRPLEKMPTILAQNDVLATVVGVSKPELCEQVDDLGLNRWAVRRLLEQLVKSCLPLKYSALL